MNIWEAARIALRGLRSNRLRSFLTMLGIIIGVAAVIVLVAFGNGLQAFINDTFGPLANVITISKAQGAISGTGAAKDLTDNDVEALRNTSKAPDILSVSASVGGSAQVQVPGGGAGIRASITGASADYLEQTNGEIVVGQFFDQSQERAKAKVAVIGSGLVTQLFNGDAGGSLGKELRLGHTQFRVIGVLKATGQSDNNVVMPIGAARSGLLGGGDTVSSITVRAVSVDAVQRATAQATAILDTRHNIRDSANRDFNVQALQNLIDQASQTLQFVTIFTAAVAGISLVVGSIGVANIMLVTVTERTREIGIRKAIGARKRAILQQFLIEATMLTAIGGLIGIVIGVGLSVAAANVLPKLIPDFPAPAVSPGSVILAFSISVAIGLVAGGFPANRAARLRPIEALRYQ